MPVTLSPVEAVALHVVQCACRRVTLRVVLWFAAAVGVYYVCVRLLGAVVDPADTTLYNPDKLRETLADFAQPTHDAMRHAPGRHRTEALCRRLLESMLEMELPKLRPKWLVNPTTKRCLELDMYNEAHQLAFEYDGANHDVYTPHYHTNEHHFEYRRLLDRLKTELCRDAGVTLIRIPWSDVAVSDPGHTARFLERLLYTHRIPYRPVTVSGPGPRAPSRPAHRSPSP